jgi:hypothetical protein
LAFLVVLTQRQQQDPFLAPQALGEADVVADLHVESAIAALCGAGLVDAAAQRLGQLQTRTVRQRCEAMIVDARRPAVAEARQASTAIQSEEATQC